MTAEVCVTAIGIAVAVIGGLLVTYGKLIGVSSQVDRITMNELPHMDAKLDKIMQEQKNRLEKCFTHDVLLEELGRKVKNFHEGSD